MSLRIITIVLFCFFGAKQIPFDVLSATAESYTGGRKGAGVGTNYEVQLVAHKSSKKMKFKNITIEGEPVGIKVFGTSGDIVSEFAKGDTLSLVASQRGKKKIDIAEVEVYLNYVVKKKSAREKLQMHYTGDLKYR